MAQKMDHLHLPGLYLVNQMECLKPTKNSWKFPTRQQLGHATIVMHVATIVVGDVVVGARSGVIIVEEMVELLTMTTREIPTKDPVMLVVVMDERIVIHVVVMDVLLVIHVTDTGT